MKNKLFTGIARMAIFVLYVILFPHVHAHFAGVFSVVNADFLVRWTLVVIAIGLLIPAILSFLEWAGTKE